MTDHPGRLHPLVEALEPNEEQRAVLARTSGDTVVTAGAGTGKTRTLAAHYLSLLAQGLPLRGVVAVTFTRKAAREMRNRVREAIRRYLLRPDLAPDERERWRSRYRELDAARIGTIHSLCAEILRAHPAALGIDPRFTVLEEGEAGVLLGQARDAALAWAADRPEMALLFAALGEGALAATLEHLLTRPLEAEEALAACPADPLGHWQALLEGWQRAGLQRLLGSEEWAAHVDELREGSPLRDGDRLVDQWRAALAALENSPSCPQEARIAFAPIDAVDLRGGSASAWAGGREEQAAIKAALRGLREMWRALLKRLELRCGPQDEALAALARPLREVHGAARRHYAALKDEAQALDFDDLERLALRLLRHEPDVLERWRSEACALLVDEFQDTNARQMELVERLDGGRGTLFVVGDAKQSIYRFRGADVTLFRRVQERVAREGGAVLSLDTTYRAHRELVGALDGLLRPVLGERADPARPWAEPFAPLTAHRDHPAPGLRAPHVELLLAVGAKADGGLERAAQALVARLAELVGSGEVRVVEGETERPLSYGDVAILCRATSSFAPYEAALEAAGIPFLTVAGRGFYERPEVRDVLNALAALCDPDDDLRLVGLLRSAAVGLTDAALYRLREACRGEDPPATMWDSLRRGDAALEGEDARRAARAVELVGDLHALVGRASVAEVLHAFLERTGYRAALLACAQARAARNLDKLLEDARTGGMVGVGHFLEYVSALRGTGVREGEARAVSEGAVQVMSVHAAKGLEFPVAVIGDVGHASSSRREALLDPRAGVLLGLKGDDDALPAVYEMAAALHDDQERAESDRLLYVAATRARERLLLSGCLSLAASGAPARCSGWLGQLLGILGLHGQPLGCDQDGAGVHRRELGLGGAAIGLEVYEPHWEPAPLVGGQTDVARDAVPAVVPPLLWTPEVAIAAVDARAAEEERRPPRRVWEVVPRALRPRAPAWVLGQVVHEALARWRLDGADQRAWARARGLSYGLGDEGQLARLAADCERLLRRFRQSPLWAEMDGADARLHEVPYARRVGGRPERGVIDALYRRDGCWTIIEFKTDDVRGPSQLADLLRREDYIAQARRYVVAVEQLLGQRPRALLCLLNYVGRVRVERLEDLEVRYL